MFKLRWRKVISNQTDLLADSMPTLVYLIGAHEYFVEIDPQRLQNARDPYTRTVCFCIITLYSHGMARHGVSYPERKDKRTPPPHPCAVSRRVDSDPPSRSFPDSWSSFELFSNL